MSSYSGAEFTTDPAYTIQTYLESRWGTNTNTDLESQLNSYLIFQGGVGIDSFLEPYSNENLLPQNLDAFVQALGTANIPGYSPIIHGPEIKTIILNSIADRLSLASVDQTAIADALADPALQPNSANFLEDVYEKAFDKFLQEFQYTGNAVNGATPTDISGVSHLNTPYFLNRFVDFTFQFASITNPTGTALNFQDIFQAFFGVNDSAFTSFLANYIKSVMYPAGGAGVGFTPNENIGEWMKKVQEAYSSSLYGSAAPTTSSVGQSFKKVVMIDQVLALIIKMIGTLQKVASSQSNRLRILTLQQTNYTDLQSQVPIFTQGDGTIFGRTDLTSKDEAQSARDQANAFNQTLTETVRSRRTTVQDEAKILQSNINQSNDSANDQASTGTALLQTLSTLLAAIFR